MVPIKSRMVNPTIIQQSLSIIRPCVYVCICIYIYILNIYIYTEHIYIIIYIYNNNIYPTIIINNPHIFGVEIGITEILTC